MKTVFLDGSSGTTGLRIRQRLAGRQDLELLTLPEEKRKDPIAKKQALNACDIALLCLPDDAAREAAAMVENDRTVILDTSTAHRTAEGWIYGFPELSKEQEEKIRSSKRIAIPGCHASGFIALVQPLRRAGILSADVLLTCQSVTGYSGGGKQMISQYETEPSPLLAAPRQYGLGQTHKHLREMQMVTGLMEAPIFCPLVSNFYNGMTVTVPLFRQQLNGHTVEDIRQLYTEQYHGPVVEFRENTSENGFFSAAAFTDQDAMELTVEGNEDRILLVARYDNLGKGASGAAVECLNLVLGIEKTTGLVL